MKLPVTNEDLRTWFRQKWVRMDTKGNIKGDCAREDGEGKPKCLPSTKAYSMSKADRATAARRKRREDPVADRPGKGGKPINVRTEEMDLEEENKPTNPALWARAKSLAKSKFDVYPSAYANGWAAKWYKSKGGGWKSVSEGVDDEGGMAKGDLETIASKAKDLSKMMKKNKQLDAWVQSKITKADDYIGSVHDFLKNGRQEVDEPMTKKTFSKLREQLESFCEDCDDALYGSVEEDFEPTGDEQYEDWDLNEEATYQYVPHNTKFPNRTSKGHYHVGITKDEQSRKGANILKHKEGGYFAASGSTSKQEGDIHKTPEAAAKAFHSKRNENLAEADTPLSYLLKNPGKKLPMHLDPNRPFDPDMPKKNPVAKAGKYGQGFSTAKHLAKQGMASVKEDETYEAANLAQQAAIAIAMKKAGKKPKNVDEAKYQKLTPRQKFTNSLARAGYDVNASSKRIQDLLAKQKKEREEREKQGVAEGYEDRKNAPSWHSASVKNPNFNDELSGRRISAPGKRLKSGKLSADERGSQERTKALIKYKQARGGLTGPKGHLPEGIELQEAEKNGRTVQLNKPFRTSDGKGKFAVYTKNDKGNVVKVNFGDTTGLTIKTGNLNRRRSFRARHNCDDPGPRHKARYWACKSWSKDTVSAGLGT